MTPDAQDSFLNAVVTGQVPVTLFLINGVKLQGHLIGYDSFCVILTRAAQQQLIYKAAIATIVPTEPLTLP